VLWDSLDSLPVRYSTSVIHRAKAIQADELIESFRRACLGLGAAEDGDRRSQLIEVLAAVWTAA
jgi:hypothetical protein